MREAWRHFAGAAFAFVFLTITASTAVAQSRNACVYANDDGGSINTVDGYLVTATSQNYVPPFQTGGESKGISSMSDIVFSPTENILYAADSQSSDIAAMRVDATTCQLTLLGNFPVAGAEALGIGLAISPDGKWLFAAGVRSANLRVYAIRQDGSLTGTRQKIALLNSPSSMAVSPDGTTLIVGVPKQPRNGPELISYSINPSTGILTQVSVVSPKGYPACMSIDPQSKFVFVDEPFGQQLRIGLAQIEPGGALTFLRTYNFPEVSGSLSTGSDLLSIDAKYLYVTDSSIASVTTLSVNDRIGALKYLSTASYGVMNEDRPIGLATSSNGTFVFAGEPNVGYGTHMGIFEAGEGGLLTSLGIFPISDENPAWVAAK
jgi:6-phosphogluconolactonase (cycloisomerase 2 family)